MIRNLHFADELSLISENMRRLKAREAFLRRGFLGDTLSRVGQDTVVEVAIIKVRKFLHDKLPTAILQDPTYWSDDRCQYLRVRPR